MSYKTQSEIMKERWKDPEWRKMMAERVSKANKKTRKGIPRSEETKKKIAASVKKWHEKMDAEEKEQFKEAVKKGINEVPESEKQKRKKKSSKSNKEAYVKDPTLKDRVKQAVKETYEKNPSLRENNQKKREAYFQTPEGQEVKKARSKAQSERLKAYYQTPESIETKKKLSEACRKTHKGRKHSKEHNQKISDTISKKIVEGKGYFGYYKYSKRGHHISPKAGKVYYRSAFELIAYKILDEDDTVSTYQTEPIRIPYVDDKGSKRFYIPDLRVCYKDNSEKIIEVRPSDMVNLDKTKFDAARLKLGTSYQIWTEKDLGLTNSWDAYSIA